MQPRPEIPADPAFRYAAPPIKGRLAPTALILLLAAVLSARPIAADLGPDGMEKPPVVLSTLVEAGPVIAIASSLGLQPQIGIFRDLPHFLQAGIQARIAFTGESEGYDILPQVDVSIRKLWPGDEDAKPIGNSEYFGVSIGGFFAYDFKGQKAGLEPYGTLSLGKYWMPFDNLPFGLDLNLELTRYFSGRLPGRTELVFITTGVHLFYVLP